MRIIGMMEYVTTRGSCKWKPLHFCHNIWLDLIITYHHHHQLSYLMHINACIKRVSSLIRCSTVVLYFSGLDPENDINNRHSRQVSITANFPRYSRPFLIFSHFPHISPTSIQNPWQISRFLRFPWWVVSLWRLWWVDQVLTCICECPIDISQT